MCSHNTAENKWNAQGKWLVRNASSQENAFEDRYERVARDGAYVLSVQIKGWKSPSDVKQDDAPEVRGAWGNQAEFFFTCVAYSVGLGNVWRFPYLVYKNGGGAFLIPYCIMLVFVGMPIFLMEISLGQFASIGPIGIWKICPIFRGLGIASVVIELTVALYYNVIIAYSIYFLFDSMRAEVPWDNCDNPWNTPSCQINSTQDGANSTQQFTPAEEYFYNKVLNISSGIDDPGDIQPMLVATLAVAWLIVFLVLIKGVGSMGKVVYFVATFPYVMLTALLINGLMLDGAIDGILYFLRPEWDRLIEMKVWRDAAVQTFYALSSCTGGLIAMSSFSNFNNNVIRDAIAIPLISLGTSLYAGLVIFSVLGFMALQKGVDVADVAEQGPGLVFVVYPEGIAQMPLPTLWAILFFMMMLVLGFGTQGTRKFCEDIQQMIDKSPGVYWRICWRFIAPAVLLFILIMSLVQYHPVVYEMPSGVYEYPDWAMAIEWSIAGIPVLIIIVVFLYTFCKGGAWSVLKDISEPEWDWGPAVEQRELQRATTSATLFKSTSELLGWNMELHERVSYTMDVDNVSNGPITFTCDDRGERY
ncbi:PREDICTED: sodium- and chloride-dependent GABA transporter ine-like [Priapulus caudatus]|uniref:Transporter n=1 Tax=Priapulus caudatus TaxID=37621 RepID=A0ABM1DXN0_PRICU|nr:PREDICTED: sodium- and chloride-dependent GABA transporter ine-like [Priapulus caudatus]